MPELESLGSQASDLVSKVNFWNNKVLLALFITFIAAGAIVICQQFVLNRSQQLSDVEKRIGKIKEDVANGRADALDQANVKLRTDLESATAESNRRQAELEKEQQKTARAQKEAAESQLKLNQWMAGKVTGRMAIFNAELFKPLGNLPKASVEVWYKENDGEAFMYAQTIIQELRGIGWNVPEMAVATSTHPVPGANGLPIIGTFVIAKTPPEPAEFSPNGILGSRTALLMRAIGANTALRNDKLSNDKYEIIIGERPAFP